MGNTQNAPHQLAIGTLLENRYEVGNVIGEGGFGITYSGIDTRLGMKIAIKEYYPFGMASRNALLSPSLTIHTGEEADMFLKGREKFLDEARVLAQFASDPGVVYVRDFFEANGTAYIVMEMLEGMSLGQYLKQNGKMSFEEAVSMMTPVIQVLHRIHEKGIIHRDISPANLMILEDKSVKVLDFGAAREYNAQAEKGLSVMLKPGYSPEEQYRSKAQQGPWTDVYAMSATIYKMITGIVPEDAMNRIFQDEIKKPSELGIAIKDYQEQAILDGMAVLATNRIQTMGDLYQRLTQTSAIIEDDERTIRGKDLEIDEDSERTVLGVSYARNETEGSNENSFDSTSERTEKQDFDNLQQTVFDSSKSIDVDYVVTAGSTEKVQQALAGETEKADVTEKSLVTEDKSVRFENKTKPKRKKKKVSIGIRIAEIAIILVIALIAGIAVYKNDPYAEGSGVYIGSEHVTKAMTSKIARDKNVTSVSFYGCEIDDAAIEKLAKSKTIQYLYITAGTGFTTLDPVAKMQGLEYLSITYYDSDEMDKNGGRYFSTDFENVTHLELCRNDLKGNTDCLKHFPNLTNLTLTECTGIGKGEFLQDMPNLVEISARGAFCQESLQYLTGCTSLESLLVDECSLTSLEPLSSMTSIISIMADDNKLTSLKGLENCAALNSVYIENNQISDISALTDKKNLYGVALANNQISDISALADASEVYNIELSNNQISDISALANKVKLGWLELEDNQISDISPLENDIKLANIYLSGNKLENLDALNKMTELKNLHADRNQITDISGICNSTQMEELYLNENQIEDISPVKNYDGKFSSVHLAMNQISDISALEGKTELKYVELYENKIKTIAPLSASENLYYVSVHDNELTNLKGLENSKSIYLVDAANNQLTDISALNDNKPSKVFYAFEHNQITDISVMGKDLNYEFLSLYDNPISSYESLYYNPNETERNYMCSGFYVQANDASDEKIKELVETGFESHVKVVGLDISMQGSFRTRFTQLLSEYKKEEAYSEPSFLTMEEADAEVLEYRYEVEGRELKSDDEENVDDSSSEM